MPLFGCFGGRETEKQRNDRKKNRDIELELLKSKKKYKATQRLLLLGAGESGSFLKSLKVNINIL